MSKKIYINEQQLSLIVNYIKEGDVKPNLNESELLDEGVKEWAMAGLMALASMTGQAQNKIHADNEQDIQHYIEAAQEVQQEIKSDPAKAMLFKDAAKQMNIENLNALLQVDPKDDVVIKKFTTNNLRAAGTGIKGGGVVTDIEITTDTTWGVLKAPLELTSTVETQLEGNLFISGGFDLNPDIAEELALQFQRISESNSTLKGVTINSSTDKEPLKKSTAQRLIDAGYSGDNEGLANARKDGIYNYLANTLNIDKELIKSDVKWSQGPDAYSPDMSDEERESAKNSPETSSARNVGVTWNIVKELQGESDEPVYKLVYRYNIEITNIEKPLKPTRIPKGGGGRVTIKLKPPTCKVKGGMIPCSFN